MFLAIDTGNEGIIAFPDYSGSIGSDITRVQLPLDRNDGQCHCGATKHADTVVTMTAV